MAAYARKSAKTLTCNKDVVPTELQASYSFGNATDPTDDLNGWETVVKGNPASVTGHLGRAHSAYKFDGSTSSGRVLVRAGEDQYEHHTVGPRGSGVETVGFESFGVSMWFKTSTPTSGMFSLQDEKNETWMNGETSPNGATDRHVWMENSQIHVSMHHRDVDPWGSKSIAVVPLDRMNPLTNDKWHHVVYTHGAAGEFVYIDGKEVYSVQNATHAGIDQTINWDGNAQIGYSVSATGAATGQQGTWMDRRYFTGTIDDVTLYKNELNQSEVDALYFDCAYDAQYNARKVLKMLTCNKDVVPTELQASYSFGNATDPTDDLNGWETVVKGNPASVTGHLGRAHSAYKFDGSTSSGRVLVRAGEDQYEHHTVGPRGSGVETVGFESFGVSMWFKTSTPTSGMFSLQDEKNETWMNGETSPNGATDRHVWMENSQIHVSMHHRDVDPWGSKSIAVVPLDRMNPLTNDKWHHVVYTHGAAGEFVYIDGKEVYSVQNATHAGIDQTINWDGNAQIGYSVSATGAATGQQGTWMDRRYFTGTIDDVTLYKNELNQSEVDALYFDCARCQSATIPSELQASFGLGSASDPSDNTNGWETTVHNSPSSVAGHLGRADSAYYFEAKSWSTSDRFIVRAGEGQYEHYNTRNDKTGGVLTGSGVETVGFKSFGVSMWFKTSTPSCGLFSLQDEGDLNQNSESQPTGIPDRSIWLDNGQMKVMKTEPQSADHALNESVP